jgi:hypothetical protein
MELRSTVLRLRAELEFAQSGGFMRIWGIW